MADETVYAALQLREPACISLPEGCFHPKGQIVDAVAP